MSKINDKEKEINKFLDELNDIIPDELNKYKKNKIIKAACERYFERIIEACTDLAFLIIKHKKLDIPEDDIDAFNILYENKILIESLSNNLKNAKKMRNIIAHQYGKVDDKIVFDSIKNELSKDIKNFIKTIQKYLKK